MCLQHETVYARLSSNKYQLQGNYQSGEDVWQQFEAKVHLVRSDSDKLVELTDG